MNWMWFWLAWICANLWWGEYVCECDLLLGWAYYVSYANLAYSESLMSASTPDMERLTYLYYSNSPIYFLHMGVYFELRPTVGYKVVNQWNINIISTYSCSAVEFLVKTTLPMILHRNLHQLENHDTQIMLKDLFSACPFCNKCKT